MSLQNKKILVGMTGGIACYKVPYLVRTLRKAGAEVKVVMTEAATKFITPLTMETVSNHEVAVAMFEQGTYVATRHIDLGEWPDLVVIVPATANFMGKVTAGVSDDLLTTVVCATARPIMIAPAMNPQMWANPITRRNFKTLLELGYQSVDPAEGEMACDHVGVGRMAEPDVILEHIKAFFSGGVAGPKGSKRGPASKKKSSKVVK
jgi:phosphopantothenoylcysteine decarboxylase/phosphopantothenate--cysteine ligase